MTVPAYSIGTTHLSGDRRRLVFGALVLVTAIAVVGPGLLSALIAVLVECDHSFRGRTDLNLFLNYFAENSGRFFSAASKVVAVAATPIPIFLVGACYSGDLDKSTDSEFNWFGVLISGILLVGIIGSFVGIELYPSSSATDQDPVYAEFRFSLYRNSSAIIHNMGNLCYETFRNSVAFLLLVLRRKAPGA